MRLIQCKERNRFEASGAYSERHELKQAGFRWDSGIRCWWTQDAEIAIKLIGSADQDTATLIRGRAAEKSAADEAAIKASRATDADIDVPAPPGKNYFGYQRAGIAYALARRDTLIADEMGLGKTIQAIGVTNAALKTGDRLRVLIVAPKIALPNWERELRNWLIKPLTIARWTTSCRDDADIVILNYDILARPEVIQELRAVVWNVIIYDESHKLKNPKAKRTQAAFGDANFGTPPIAAERRLFLTGTPIVNRPIELFPMLRAMSLSIAQNYHEYARRYCDGHDTHYGFDTKGASNLDELQRILRSTCMVRRLKADVLTQLPPKRYELVEFDADDVQTLAALADERRELKEWDSKITQLRGSVSTAQRSGNKEAFREAIRRLEEGARARLAEISRLRHSTALAKVPQVIEHVIGVLESTADAVLLFAHHRDVIAKLRDQLYEAGHDAAVITGATGETERGRAQEAIKKGQKRLFIGSMHACGVAINLQEASTVVFAEQDWTPSVMAQCEDRAHRIGQHNSVLVQHLVLTGSIDCISAQDFAASSSIDPQMAKTVAIKEHVIDEALDRVEMSTNVLVETKSEADLNFVAPVEVADVSARQAEVAMPTVDPPRRKRGRPPKGGRPLTEAEHNRRWREGSERVALEDIAEQLRAISSQTGATNANILRLALLRLAEDSIAEPGIDRSRGKGHLT